MDWNDLTDRQKDLDKRIDPSGIQIQNTPECLEIVMNAIGAHPDEADFILSRIQLRIRTQQVLEETDPLIGRIEGTLEKFKQDDAELERILRQLGIKFPRS